MARFRHFIGIDWSGAAGPRQKGIAVALCSLDGAAPRLLEPPGHRHWSRMEVLDLLLHGLPSDALVGMDLGTALPFADAGAFFPGLPSSPADARALWALIDAVCADDPHLGAASFVDHPDFAPYFRRHGGREGALFHLPGAAHRQGRMRLTEIAQARAGCRPTSNFNLVGAAQVGKSSLTGMRLLHRLAGRIPVWPFDPLAGSGPVVLEIYTALAAIAAGRRAGAAKMTSADALNAALAALGSPPVTAMGQLDDHACDALVTAAWLRRAAFCDELWCPQEMTREIALTEGWTFGAR
ncbi:hypothetical protein [Novosphingobium colocasiae]|uniref:DUF429 domain-containing protein n=1 Tax=Novosphingobium colocasiae TaxID=1256513 RepID=A0A918UCX8_9SPHN|nr:hypothetical protein [Novosphingobium colocasiae]GGY90891.1 hypothetical protein GCM10011614_01960 [Novosphingobium colocasiae]